MIAATRRQTNPKQSTGRRVVVKIGEGDPQECDSEDLPSMDMEAEGRVGL